MNTILIIQSRARPEMVAGEQDEYRRAFTGTGFIPVFQSALDTSLPWNEPASIIGDARGVMLAGSGEYDFNGGRDLHDPARATSQQILTTLTPFLEYVFARDIPTLGICYGHQIIGEWREGKVSNDQTQKKSGSYEVSLTEVGRADPLFMGMPAVFIAQYGHKDSLTTLPKGAICIATGTNCRYSALKYGSNIYTFQFHPELTAEDISKKLSLSPGYLPEGIALTDVIKASPEASSLIPRFLELLG